MPKPNPKVFFEMMIDGQPAGRIEMVLRADVVPKTAENFRALCTGEKGTGALGKKLSYKGTSFHRIIPGFMAQGGCPLGSGTGSPGYNVPLEVSREALHDKAGVLSMARSSNPNSAGSQFFITFGPTRQLDMQYSVFGQVTEGLDVVKKLEAAGNPNPSSNGVPPRKNVTITRARVDWVPPTAE